MTIYAMGKTKKKILTKQQLQDYGRRHRDDPRSKDVVRMAEERRHSYYKAKRGRKRKRKRYLRSTDYLSLKQVKQILKIVKAEESRTLNGAVRNEMIVHLLLETGMRASEICDLRLICLPSYHGHLEIEVVDGKGKKDRTIRISKKFKKRLDEYICRYHRGHGLEGFLFRNERRRRMTRQSIYTKIKRIGIKAGIWLYHKNGKLKTRLSPQKFRHTYATHLFAETGNLILVKEQLGHVSTDTTAIYARVLTENVDPGLESLTNRFGVVENTENESDLIQKTGK